MGMLFLAMLRGPIVVVVIAVCGCQLSYPTENRLPISVRKNYRALIPGDLANREYWDGWMRYQLQYLDGAGDLDLTWFKGPECTADENEGYQASMNVISQFEKIHGQEVTEAKLQELHVRLGVGVGFDDKPINEHE